MEKIRRRRAQHNTSCWTPEDRSSDLDTGRKPKAEGGRGASFTSLRDVQPILAELALGRASAVKSVRVRGSGSRARKRQARPIGHRGLLYSPRPPLHFAKGEVHKPCPPPRGRPLRPEGEAASGHREALGPEGFGSAKSTEYLPTFANERLVDFAFGEVHKQRSEVPRKARRDIFMVILC